MPPGLRKLALTAHVTFSVGWIGAVIVFIALAVVGLMSADPAMVRGAYLVMEPAAWFVLLPLAAFTLVTGIISSLGTSWGLLRHWWIVFKLVIAAFATVVLLTYMETFAFLAAMAADPRSDLDAVRNPSPLLHAGLALGALLVPMVLSVFKPRGMTPWVRGQPTERPGPSGTSADEGQRKSAVMQVDP